MLVSAATINPALIAPPHAARTRLLRPHSGLLCPSPPPQRFLKRNICNTNAATASERLTSVKTAVAAVDSSESAVKVQQEAISKYYFVVANAKFMLDEEEHFQEQLFERLRLFKDRNQEKDFWLVIEPKFLEKFPNITKRLKRPAVALVSTNGSWITFMRLRLDRVLTESFEAGSIEEALAYNPVKIEFEKPENWAAPYPKYKTGWWEPFLPPGGPELPKKA